MDYLEIRELCHHGIKGQRWGVRRYQNEDGTLTAEGKTRYGVDSEGKMSKEGKKLYKQDVHDQKVLNRSSGANAAISGAKTFGAFYAADWALVGAAALVGTYIGTRVDALGGMKIMKGAEVTSNILSAVGLGAIAVSAVMGATEKSRIKKSQEGGTK